MKNLTDLREKYRPRKRSDFVGIQRPIKQVTNMAKSGIVPNGMAFIGLPGTGKTSLAYWTAKALHCEHFTDDVCGSCKSCVAKEKHFPGGSMDFYVYDSANLSEKTLDDILRYDLFYLSSNRIGKRIYFFDETQRFSYRAQDKFLKPLENVRTALFMFCLIDPLKLEDAFRQRVMVIKTSPPELSEVVPWLAKKCELAGITVKEKEALFYLAECTKRIPRECLSLLQIILNYEEPLTLALAKVVGQSVFNDEKSPTIIKIC